MRASVRRLLAVLAFSVPPACIGWLDQLNGPDYGLSLFYLVPIGLGGWLYGRTVGLVTAVQCAAWWLWADFAEHPVRSAGPTLWNGFTRLAIYLTIGLGSAAMRADRRRLQELIEHEQRLGRIDALTGLENGRSFREHLRQDLARAARHGTSLCVAYIDIDNFKRVNDQHGHGAGDELLRDIGCLIREQLRAGDRAARLGGDEFALLLWAADQASGSIVAQRIVAAIQELGRRYPEARLGASAGLAASNSASTSVDTLLHDADEAMYEVKRLGKGQVRASLRPPAP